MKKMFTKVFFIILCILLITIQNPQYFNLNVNAASKDIYDVILFWGQSNMLGKCGKITDEFDETLPDSRYKGKNRKFTYTKYSKLTKIDKTFLSNAVQLNYVKIEQKKNSVFEYNYLSNKLVPITAKTKKLGEALEYNTDTKNKSKSKDKNTELISSKSSRNGLQRSLSTNMIPQFCKKYHEQTGHKVVVILAANGGEPISAFLPSESKKYKDNENKHLYECMTIKYNAAIQYLKDSNYTIGRKLYVCAQGCQDVSLKTSKSEYIELFKKVHSSLKKDLGITKGAIVETAYISGLLGFSSSDSYFIRVQTIHEAQKSLIAENKDIILGSSFIYDHYVPDKASYESTEFKNNIYLDKGKKMPYNKALARARYVVCYPTNNSIHLTSSALCQVGDDVAVNLAESFKKK